jgi:hypothetical protein
VPLTTVIDEQLYLKCYAEPTLVKFKALHESAQSDLETCFNTKISPFRIYEAYLLNRDSKVLTKAGRFAAEVQVYDSLALPLPIFVVLTTHKLAASAEVIVIAYLLALLLLLVFTFRAFALREFQRLTLLLGYVLGRATEEETHCFVKAKIG